MAGGCEYGYDIREKTGLNEIVPHLEDVSLPSAPPAENTKTQCWPKSVLDKERS